MTEAQCFNNFMKKPKLIFIVLFVLQWTFAIEAAINSNIISILVNSGLFFNFAT